MRCEVEIDDRAVVRIGGIEREVDASVDPLVRAGTSERLPAEHELAMLDDHANDARLRRRRERDDEESGE